MPDFTHNVRVVDPVDPFLAKAFSDVLQPMQGAMSRISQEYSRLKEKSEELERNNSFLRQSNQRLQEQVEQLTERLRRQEQQLPPQPPAPPAPRRDNLYPQTRRESFQPVRFVQRHEAPVHSVTIGPASMLGASSDMVVTASWDCSVNLFSLDNVENMRRLGTPEAAPRKERESGKMGGLYAVAFSKTSPEILGCTSCDKNVYLWNHQRGALVSTHGGHTDEVNAIDFHECQQVMVTASDDCKAIIWDFQEGLQLRTLDKHEKSVYGATFLGKENQFLVATCSFDRKTRVYDMREKKVVATMTLHTDDVIGLDYNPHQNILATGADDGLISFWDSRTWSALQTINTKVISGFEDNEVKKIAFSPCGRSVAAGSSCGYALVYDVTGAEPRNTGRLGGHSDCCFDVAWGTCPDTGARMLVTASHDCTSRVWREG